MDTTFDSSGYLLDEPVRREPSRALGVVLSMLATLATLLALFVTGAYFLQLAGPDVQVHTSPALLRMSAAAVALLVAVVIPWRVESRVGRARRRWNPLARHVGGGAFFAVNLLTVAALTLLTPDMTRAALVNHGTWMLGGVSRVLDAGSQRVGTSLAMRVPVNNPLALSHRTEWPFVLASPRGVAAGACRK